MIDLKQIIITDLLNPSTPEGAVFYAVLFLSLAAIATGVIRRIANRIISRGGGSRADYTSVVFIRQLGGVAAYLIAAIFYSHLIPSLRALEVAEREQQTTTHWTRITTTRIRSMANSS